LPRFLENSEAGMVGIFKVGESGKSWKNENVALNLYLVGARFLETETSYRIQTQSGKSWGKVNVVQKMWSD